MSEGFNNSIETVNFRRFLSYIYAYEDEVKLRNVGFVKAQMRMEQVQLQVCVNGITQMGGRPLELCLLDRLLQKIPVAMISLQNGHGEYRGSSTLENCFGSGMHFSEIYGLCLQGTGSRRYYYMTLWRERPKPAAFREDDGGFEAVESLLSRQTKEVSQKGKTSVEKGLNLWKKLCSVYPSIEIQPTQLPMCGFDDAKGPPKLGEAIRIQPNDIGRLPRNNWILAQNSFVLHTYNYFHQLILFRIESEDALSSRWFIGLPGDFNEQEQMVAEVFGFKRYLPCENGGYWYSEIMMC